MRFLAVWIGALALLLSPSVAAAQAAPGKSIQATAGYLPAEAIYCDDGTGHAVVCTFDTVVKGVAVDRGAVVGTTPFPLMPTNPARRGFSIQNQSASASCYVSGQAAATTDFHSLFIAPGALYETPITHVGTGAVSIVCTAAATSIYAREF